MDDNYPDPFQEAVQHGMQRAIQLGSFALTAAQIYAYRQRTQARAAAERHQTARRALNDQIQAERDAARAGWAPALDPAWLREASLIQAARAWGAAMPYADRDAPWYEPAAATALRNSEERLRDLHPYAMAYYDRLRADGLGPAEAMYQAAPLFTRHPHTHDAPSTPRQALRAGTGIQAPWTAPVNQAGGPGSPAAPDGLEQRGRQIAQTLQAQARSRGRDPLGPDELRTVLETVTNLPAHVIDWITRRRPGRPAMGTRLPHAHPRRRRHHQPHSPVGSPGRRSVSYRNPAASPAGPAMTSDHIPDWPAGQPGPLRTGQDWATWLRHTARGRARGPRWSMSPAAPVSQCSTRTAAMPKRSPPGRTAASTSMRTPHPCRP